MRNKKFPDERYRVHVFSAAPGDELADTVGRRGRSHEVELRRAEAAPAEVQEPEPEPGAWSLEPGAWSTGRKAQV